MIRNSKTVTPDRAVKEPAVDPEAIMNDYERNISRQLASQRLVDALLDCAPEDRIPFLEILLEQMRPKPEPGMASPEIQQATEWAATASRREIKAHLLLGYQNLSPDDQESFRDYANGPDA